MKLFALICMYYINTFGYTELYTVNDDTFTIYAADIDDQEGDSCDKICTDAGMYCPDNEITNTATTEAEMDTLVGNVQGITVTCVAYSPVIDFFKTAPYVIGLSGSSPGCRYKTELSYIFECSKVLQTEFTGQFCPCKFVSPPPSPPPSPPIYWQYNDGWKNGGGECYQNDKTIGTSDPFLGTLVEAQAFCGTIAECQYVYDFQCDGGSWRACKTVILTGGESCGYSREVEPPSAPPPPSSPPSPPPPSPPFCETYSVKFNPTNGENSRYRLLIPLYNYGIGEYTLNASVYYSSGYNGEERVFHSRWFNSSDGEIVTEFGAANAPVDEWHSVSITVNVNEIPSYAQWYVGYPVASTTGYMWVTNLQFTTPNGHPLLADGTFPNGNNMEYYDGSPVTVEIVPTCSFAPSPPPPQPPPSPPPPSPPPSSPPPSPYYIFIPVGVTAMILIIGFVAYIIYRNAVMVRTEEMQQIITERKQPVKKPLQKNMGYGKSRFNKPSRFLKKHTRRLS